MKHSLVVAALVAAGLTACSADDGKTITVDIGYQSKTINTVTAGTLLKDLGYFDKKLAELGKTKGVTYKLVWHDFASGPPLTAEMIAGKVAIGSMGDYPLLVNGSKTAAFPDVESRLVAVTGYNLRGSLNQIVVKTDSSAKSLGDLKGKVISTSVGSAAHGMLVRGLSDLGLKATDVQVLGQDPPVGVTAVSSGQVAALAQFVPFPQRLIFKGEGRLLYDGGSTGIPTFHGVVVRDKWAKENPEVTQAFLSAAQEATDYLHKNPLESAERVAKATGIEPEVVYLYNGPGGVVTFDLTLKTQLVDALRKDVPFLKELGSIKELDVTKFVDESALRTVLGANYDKQRDSLLNPSPITGRDEVCAADVKDPATASEVWFADGIKPASTPACLLKSIKKGGTVRAAYVPATDTGTRLFATAATWVQDGTKLLPFATLDTASAHLSKNPAAKILTYDAALAAS